MNDDHSPRRNDNLPPRIDVLDDDGAPQGGRQTRAQPSDVPESEQPRTASPRQAPAQDDPDKAGPQRTLQRILYRNMTVRHAPDRPAASSLPRAGEHST